MAVKKEFSNFQELLTTSEIPVLVDFYAEWCGPCHMMSPILEEVNTEMKNKLQVVKVDTEKYPNLASQYGIEALPTLILFKNAEVVERIQGVHKAPQLIELLESLL